MGQLYCWGNKGWARIDVQTLKEQKKPFSLLPNHWKNAAGTWSLSIFKAIHCFEHNLPYNQDAFVVREGRTNWQKDIFKVLLEPHEVNKSDFLWQRWHKWAIWRLPLRAGYEYLQPHRLHSVRRQILNWRFQNFHLQQQRQASLEQSPRIQLINLRI